MREVKSLLQTRGATRLKRDAVPAIETKRSETGLRAPTSPRLALPFLIASPLAHPALVLWNTRDIDLEMHRNGERVPSI